MDPNPARSFSQIGAVYVARECTRTQPRVFLQSYERGGFSPKMIASLKTAQQRSAWRGMWKAALTLIDRNSGKPDYFLARPVLYSFRRRTVARRRGRRQLADIVLQHTDFDAITSAALGCGALSSSWRCVAHSHRIDAICRDFVIEHQVSYDRVCHSSRRGNGSLTAARRVTVNFENVSALIF